MHPNALPPLAKDFSFREEELYGMDIVLLSEEVVLLHLSLSLESYSRDSS